MLPKSTRRHLTRTVPLFAVLLFSGACSDAPLPLAPAADARVNMLPANVLVVTNTDDAGPGSLRQTILDATDGAVIGFDASIAGGKIVLTSGQIDIDKSLTIEGPVPAGITISGGHFSRVFMVKSLANVLIRNLAIVDGFEKFGGGLAIEGHVVLDHVLVANNEAYGADGGGIAVGVSGTLTLVNSTVSGNVSPQAGGAIYSAGDLSVRSSTIAFNTAGGSKGGVNARAGFTVRNSIIASNNAPVGTESNCGFGPDAVPTFTGKNLSNDGSCGSDPSMIIGSAGLLPLANNGGPTLTHALHFSSLAIDDAACNESTDQRHVTRPQGISCDIGAFEFTDFGAYTITMGPNVGVNKKTGVATVGGTITCSRSFSAPLSLRVAMQQTQRTQGKFSTIVSQSILLQIASCGPSASSWSATLAPQSGSFDNGAATGTVTTEIYDRSFRPTNVTTELKVFQVK